MRGRVPGIIAGRAVHRNLPWFCRQVHARHVACFDGAFGYERISAFCRLFFVDTGCAAQYRRFVFVRYFLHVIQERLFAGTDSLGLQHGQFGVEQVDIRTFQRQRFSRHAFVHHGSNDVCAAFQIKVVLRFQLSGLRFKCFLYSGKIGLITVRLQHKIFRFFAQHIDFAFSCGIFACLRIVQSQLLEQVCGRRFIGVAAGIPPFHRRLVRVDILPTIYQHTAVLHPLGDVLVVFRFHRLHVGIRHD